MWKTVLRRVLIMIPQLILLSIIVFMLAKMMPGDPFTGLINPNSSPKEIARLKQAYGLNDPVPCNTYAGLRTSCMVIWGKATSSTSQ